MKNFSACLVSTFKSTWFSSTIDGGSYPNTRKDVAWSILPVLLAWAVVSAYFGFFVLCSHFPCNNTASLFGVYLAALWTVAIIAFPKFFIFFGLTWHLCRLFNQSDRFCAFIVANNWFYVNYTVIYALITVVEFTAYKYISNPQIWPLATTFYLCLVVNFLAHRVLGLRQEVSWIVPMCFLFAHALIRALTGKHGMMFVF